MINSNVFDFQFFLAGRQEVASLEAGAIKNGGATKLDNKIVSNVEAGELINVNNVKNELSLYIPSTTEVSETCDNSFYVSSVITDLVKTYNLNDIKFYDTKGSWFSEDNNIVVVEDITIVTLELNKIEIEDINNFVRLANWIKKEMSQEGVSITINDSLGIV